MAIKKSGISTTLIFYSIISFTVETISVTIVLMLSGVAYLATSISISTSFEGMKIKIVQRMIEEIIAHLTTFLLVEKA
jgi:hypothetical protein